MIIIKFFSVNNLNKIFDPTKSLDLTKQKSPEITISAYVPITTLVLNHILKFKILYILGFILLFVIYLLKQHIAIGLCFYIDIFSPVSSSGEEQNPRWPFLFSWIKNASKGKKGALSVERREAIDFFVLDETSTEKKLEEKKNLKFQIMESIYSRTVLDDKIMKKILRDSKEIIWYYSLLKGTMVPSN